MKCKPYSEITVESGTQLETVHICSVCMYKIDVTDKDGRNNDAIPNHYHT